MHASANNTLNSGGFFSVVSFLQNKGGHHRSHCELRKLDSNVTITMFVKPQLLKVTRT